MIYLVITLVVTLSFGILPYKSNILKKFTLFMGIFNAFSGGMFLSMGMVHILPEAMATYRLGRKVFDLE
jgi:zinc transporter 1/2/3